MIITRTPYRISFFGGGTDFPAWYREHGGAVLAATIDKYCYISCRYLPPFFEHKHRVVYSLIENVKTIGEIKHPAVRAVLEHHGCERGLEIHHDGDLPARSGLGTSSSFTVGLLHALSALEGKYISKEALASKAIYMEQDVIREHVGSQDQISAAFGGCNRVEFRQNDTFQVSSIVLPRERLNEFESCLMLFFTGFSRIASDIEKSKIESLKQHEADLRRMRQMVDEGVEILQASHVGLSNFGKLLDEAWKYKRRLSDKVSTQEIDEIYERALEAGAIGGKILGAGGGGFLLLFAMPDRHRAIKESLRNLVHVPFHFENSGSRVVLYQPDGLS